MLSKIRNTHFSNANIKGEQRGQLRRIVVLLTMTIFGSLSICHAQTTNSAGGPPASDLKVMTWNIHGGQREGRGCPARIPCKLIDQSDKYLSHIIEEINRHEGLDVIALQEVYRSQARILAQTLAITRGFYEKPYFVETRSCGPQGAADNDFGIAIISRYPFIDVERVKLDPPFFAGPERRMLARVIIHVSDRDVHVYNTHLAPNDFLRMGEVERLRTQVIKDRNSPRDFAFRPVLMGDLNAEPGSWTYRQIRRDLFLDAWDQVHDEECTETTPGSENGCTLDTFKPDQRADYILPGSGGVFRVDFAQVTSKESLFDIFGLTKDGRKPNARTDCNKVPDHLPVVAHLSFRFVAPSD
jgi:endonuclease/exonuclease/phosphatase family metal-dependent hydrolase